MKEIYEILRYITVFQFFFFFFFLIGNQKGKPLSNRLLALFVLSKGICYLNGIVYQYKSYFLLHLPDLFYIRYSFEFLLAPTLYLYIKSITYRNFKLSGKAWLHAIPFIVCGLYFVFNYHIYSVDTKRLLLNNNVFFPAGVKDLYWYILHVHIIVYCLLGLRLLKSYRQALKNQFSSFDKINLNWLSTLTWFFLIIWMVSFVELLLNHTGLHFRVPRLLYISSIFLFANTIVFKGLKQPQIFIGIEVMNNKPKYIGSTLTEVQRKKYLEKIESHMNLEKTFMDPLITLEMLAKNMSIPPRHLSQVLNESLKTNFYDFINKYRIEESKQLLVNPDNQNKTVLEILYDVGFNSKSVFNTAFKANTGTTPTEFRRQHLD
jgi:AraC-like DNA-binding protein